MKLITMKFRGYKGEMMNIRSDFLWGLGFPVMSRRIARRVFSLIWVAQDKRLTVVGENYLRERFQEQ